VNELSKIEKQMLDLEGEQFRYIATKHKQIYKKFQLSVIDYYRIVNKIIDKQEALFYAPFTVERLKSIRKQHAEFTRNKS
jgi:hypothetical protein